MTEARRREIDEMLDGLYKEAPQAYRDSNHVKLADIIGKYEELTEELLGLLDHLRKQTPCVCD